LGRRVAHTVGSTTTVFVQAGQQTIADYASGAAPASSTYRYIYASYIDEPVMRWQTSNSTPVYYHRTQQYSITAITSSTGSVLERYAYTAYGLPSFFDGSGSSLQTSNFAIRTLFTGREWDNDIQQYHYRARMYDASLGRFCSRDPIGYHSSTNAYDYTKDTPLVAIDPLGLDSDLPFPPPLNPTSHKVCVNWRSSELSICNRMLDPERSVCTAIVEAAYKKCLERFTPEGVILNLKNNFGKYPSCNLCNEELLASILPKLKTAVGGTTPHNGILDPCERWCRGFNDALQSHGGLPPECVYESECSYAFDIGFFGGHVVYRIVMCDGSVIYVDDDVLGIAGAIYTPSGAKHVFFTPWPYFPKNVKDCCDKITIPQLPK
jgi:RHS repeat-associated protein